MQQTTAQRVRSKKLRALQVASGKPWEAVVGEWENSALSQPQIAQRWNALVRDVAPGVQFSQQDVCLAFRKARQAREVA